MKHRIRRSYFFLIIAFTGMIVGIGQWWMYRSGLPAWQPYPAVLLFFIGPVLFLIPNITARPPSLLLAKIASWFGGFWFIFFYYSLWLLVLYFIVFLLAVLTGNLLLWNAWSGTLSLVGFSAIWLVIAIGTWRAFHPVYREITVETAKRLEQDITIAFASDIHLGMLLSNRYCRRLVRKINAVRADIILFGGDMVDGNLDFVIRDGSFQGLGSLHAHGGIYSVFGNHDYISQEPEREQAQLAPLGIQFLKDKTVEPLPGLQITGVDDYLHHPIQAVPHHTDASFHILIDHEPWRILSAAESGYDVYLAGHTHAGQFFPNRFFTRHLYELDYGMKRFGSMIAIVSSGYGLWALPVRIGPAPEIVVLHIKRKLQ